MNGYPRSFNPSSWRLPPLDNGKDVIIAFRRIIDGSSMTFAVFSSAAIPARIFDRLIDSSCTALAFQRVLYSPD